MRTGRAGRARLGGPGGRWRGGADRALAHPRPSVVPCSSISKPFALRLPLRALGRTTDRPWGGDVWSPPWARVETPGPPRAWKGARDMTIPIHDGRAVRCRAAWRGRGRRPPPHHPWRGERRRSSSPRRPAACCGPLDPPPWRRSRCWPSWLPPAAPPRSTGSSGGEPARDQRLRCLVADRRVRAARRGLHGRPPGVTVTFNFAGSNAPGRRKAAAGAPLDQCSPQPTPRKWMRPAASTGAPQGVRRQQASSPSRRQSRAHRRAQELARKELKVVLGGAESATGTVR